MLSWIDCMDFIDIDRETIDVIASHEHLSVSVATGLADRLVADREGIETLHRMHRELIARARASDDLARERGLTHVYSKFSRKYPMPGLTA